MSNIYQIAIVTLCSSPHENHETSDKSILEDKQTILSLKLLLLIFTTYRQNANVYELFMTINYKTHNVKVVNIH